MAQAPGIRFNSTSYAECGIFLLSAVLNCSCCVFLQRDGQSLLRGLEKKDELVPEIYSDQNRHNGGSKQPCSHLEQLTPQMIA